MKRIDYLDASKAIGMYLVYYGHFIEKLYYAGASSIFSELKLIYAFHVPLFFFLAGIFWKPDSAPIWKIFATKFKTRIMPTFFFGLIAIPFFVFLDKFSANAILEKIMAYTIGQPKLNWVTWFLVCLFTLEMLIAVISKIAPFSNKTKAIAYALAFFLIGWLLADNAGQITELTNIPVNFWFINEAFTAGGFYLLGYCAKDWLLIPT
jgi:fucose 4-O-acetylase-like acetyltransferase